MMACGEQVMIALYTENRGLNIKGVLVSLGMNEMITG